MKAQSFIGRFSLLQQWMAATAISILPLIVAASYAILSLQKQSSYQASIIEQVSSVTSSNAAISKQINDMLRISRQFALIQEPSFLDLYAQKQRALEQSLDNIGIHLTDPKSRHEIELLKTIAINISDILKSNSQETRENLDSSLQLIASLSESLSRRSEIFRQNSLKVVEEAYQNISQRIFIITTFTLPGTILLMIVGTYVISRPLLRLNQDIQRLASQNWETPISLQGPSDLVGLEKNLEWMRKQILATDRQKTAFVQHITHELKTPLAAIIEGSNLIHEEIPGPLNSKQQAILNVVRGNASNLEHLIQQLLNYNVVSHGLVAHWESIDLHKLCHLIRNQLESSNPEKQAQWNFSGPQNSISSDTCLLEMIIKNLCGNAFQYIPDNGIIAVHWEKEAKVWRLVVSDNGPGISSTDIGNIYTPFYRGESGAQSYVPKTGIGLSIVKECVHLLNGNIETMSETGKGATFKMTFPLTVQ